MQVLFLVKQKLQSLFLEIELITRENWQWVFAITSKRESKAPTGAFFMGSTR